MQQFVGNQQTQQHLQRHPTRGPGITTPNTLPDGPLPGAIAPVDTSENVDAEGNRITRAPSGRWHLTALPQNLHFPLASGTKPELLPLNPNAAFEALHVRCQAVQAQQLANAERLRGDMKYWFAKVYYFVTTYELEAIANGVYQYPHMKMQEVILFNETYQVNLAQWEQGAHDRVESNWREAFAAADDENGGTWYLPGSKEIGNALLPSMEAHIRFDLPRAMASAYRTHYAGIPGTAIDDFQADFYRMGPVFDEAQAALLPEMDEYTYGFDPGSWGPVRDTVFPFMFHVGMEREHAWERAEYLATQRRARADDVARGLHNSQTARHPLQTALFDVDGAEIQDYKWMQQPGEQPDPQPPGPRHLPAPSAPTLRRIYFRYDRPRGAENLEEAVRPDQDLRFGMN
ncbi:hypothetical protein HC891_11515 [Candidatus Gracilibacteria bacterium]|nr:hypothetical protein [Candidatus Gracilibacteria bacterium]